MLTDAEKIRELARLHTELRALEAEYAATTAAIREHINELCGLPDGRPRKQKPMSSATFLALGRASVGGRRRERVAQG